MAVKKIINYSNFNQYPWLIEFLKESDVKGVLEANDPQFNDIETVLFSMLTDMWIDNSEGEQLDVLGAHVGVSRNGRDDTNYRTVIRAKIEINVSSGQPEKVILAVKTLFEVTDVEYTPEYPGKFRIWINGSFEVLLFSEWELTGGDTLITGDGDSLFFTIPDPTVLGSLLDIIPSGVGLLLAENLVDDVDNFIIDNNGDEFVATTFLT